MIYQPLMLLFLILLTTFYFCYTFFQAKKAIEYKNDERWQLIQYNTNRVVMWYFNALTCALFIGVIIISIFGVKIDVDIEKIFTYGAYILSIRYAIEFLALRHFDKVL